MTDGSAGAGGGTDPAAAAATRAAGGAAAGSAAATRQLPSDAPEGVSTIRLELEHDYRFAIDFGESFPPFAADEPPPLGEGSAPNASRLLGAAIGNCLAASLLYCLRRARVDVQGMQAEVKVTPARNAAGRLRIGSVEVDLHPGLQLAPEDAGRVARCLELFEDFCVVTGSVREGIPVQVRVDGEEPAATRSRT